MKGAVVCFVAFLCVVQMVNANSLEILKAQLQESRNEVETTKRTLTWELNNMDRNLQSEFLDNKLNSMQAVNGMVNRVMNEIREDGAAANEAGKNADECVENARLALRAVSTNAFKLLDNCGEEALKVLVQWKNTVNELILIGDKLLNELNGIFPSCYSSNIFDMQSCITIKLSQTNSAVRSYKSTANSVQNSIASATNTGLVQATSCFNTVVYQTIPQISPIETTAKNCISNL